MRKPLIILKTFGCLVLCFPLVVIILIFSLGLYASWSNNNPEKGENVKSVDWLPAGATDVSYYKTYSWTAYEFSIEEDAFKEWAYERWELAEIKDPVSISRYKYFLIKYPNTDHMTELNAIEDSIDDYKKQTSVTITNGIYYGNRRGNGGGVQVGYDRKNNRAYIQSNPR